MVSKELKKARDYEAGKMKEIGREERPAFHLTGGCGWINDPNGFSFYRGEYHLFYQYHPFSNVWGPMHWGHAKSRDLLHWDRLPVAMAPDTSCDCAGCFSGSALTLPDGRHLLMYTGVHSDIGDGDDRERFQTQCLAFGDGVNYEKYEGNPVICPDMIPWECRATDFRDPKIWQESDGTYRCVAAAMTAERNSRIVRFRSTDALSWEYDGVIAESTAQLGGMWECPDYFELDGKQVLCVSPMAMMPEGREYHAGHNTLALVGDEDLVTHEFCRESMQQIDSGIDFYAPQTMLTPDGRRVMVGWMQAWSNSKFVPPGVKYFGQLSLPRELHVRNGRLIQQPVRELMEFLTEAVILKNVGMGSEKRAFEGIEGRLLDMTVTVRDLSELKKLEIFVAADSTYHTSVSFMPKRKLLRIDRSYSGYLYDIVHTRDMDVETENGELVIRFVMDRYSLELFIGKGERTATLSLFTPLSAQGIYFRAEGKTVIDIEKYTISELS